jgi:hypothetical protein
MFFSSKSSKEAIRTQFKSSAWAACGNSYVTMPRARFFFTMTSRLFISNIQVQKVCCGKYADKDK